jgi:hypothetical protein
MSKPATSVLVADYSGPPPVLVAATSEAACARALTGIEAAGFRVTTVAIDDAVERLAIQPSASAVWLEIDHDGGATLDRLFDRVEAEAATGRFPAVVSVTANLIDIATARIAGRSIDLLADATVAERIACLAMLPRMRGEKPRLRDIASEPNAARLRQLSDEVGRIAATLARLSAGPEKTAPARSRPDPHPEGSPAVSLDQLRQLIRARRLRSRFFDDELFADPAWDMLLDLFLAEAAQHRVPVSSLCIAAAVPPTTALRWIRSMTESGLLQRKPDPNDGRRVFIELSPRASRAMRNYFAEVGAMPVL